MYIGMGDGFGVYIGVDNGICVSIYGNDRNICMRMRVGIGSEFVLGIFCKFVVCMYIV